MNNNNKINAIFLEKNILIATSKNIYYVREKNS